MTTARFLVHLRERGIDVRAEGDKLVVNAPKGAFTETLADDLRRRKAEILAFLQLGAASSDAPSAGDGGGGSALVGLSPTTLPQGPDGSLEAPLSFGQRRLFYLDQLEPGLAVYNVPVAFWLSGHLDANILRAALGSLLERHAILRTTLVLGKDGAVQRIAKTVPLDLKVADLTGESDSARREERRRAMLTEHACQPFDLATGPLVRFLLIRLSDSENILLTTAHHVVTDGSSQDILEREIIALYDAHLRNVVPTLEPPSLQYADYAVWQEKTRNNPGRQTRLRYWKTALAGALSILDLPTAGPRPEMAPTRGDIEAATLPKHLLDPLSAIGRREKATLFMVLLAAYATLLYRFTGQDEVIVGTPIANRTQAETLNMIGYFANTLALRLDLSKNPTFRELLLRVRAVCLEAYAHQDIPFEEIVEVLNVTRDLGRSPIFQTIFAFEDAMSVGPLHPPSQAGNTPEAAPPLAVRNVGAPHPSATPRVVKRDTIHAKVARTDLSAWVSAGQDGLVITLEYPTALLDAPATRRFLDSFAVLLEGIAKNPDSRLDQLPILSPLERTKIVSVWNETRTPLPALAFAHQLFEEQAARTPTAPALQFGDEVHSYGELAEKVNRLANHLAHQGAGPGTLVGVFLERSATMVVALLAVLSTGAAYVPIDPEYPADRIAWMISDSKLCLVVTSESVADNLPSEATAVVLDGEADFDIIAACSTEKVTFAPHSTGQSPSEAPCYVIYTSGSTGRPKGVVVPHRALLNFLVSMAVRPGLAASDTLVAVTTLSFDIAGLEIFLPLSVGAKVVIASADCASDGRELRSLLESVGATAMQATPATWRLLSAAGFRSKPPLSTPAEGRTPGGTPPPPPFKILVGGEALPSDLLPSLFAMGTEVWNMYGPTETTIWSTCARITPDDPRITIGFPIANTSALVLDGRCEPVPVGVRGELHLGGTGVSLGYLGRPDLTAERFIADPFQGGHALLYKTGDLVSQRADGALVYHRRLDHQVKLRGYRIEPGEIEAVLTTHPAVAEGVVIVREDRPGDARLVAYLVPKNGRTLTASDVRKHLRTRLPEYMIPQHVVELRALPLTPAGKVARWGLPPPVGVAPAPTSRPPETGSERMLAKIWGDILGTDRITAADNFFDVGGRSLLSMVVVARVQMETGVRVTPRDLLLQSLEQIAARLFPAESQA